ncbi:MAG TPA: efflux RND transporter periplasmic adaptor subunit [Bradyrhizobium sp.]|uniref:efflux RND transporter periplasmic adaptor subunit n=1 Tax=Bradyrhizobium sp. TaxID=376 RepID=UPI002B688F38|nr:efflux RND transporter periplasmic adaptor subunit [Bradyrhizobium sp.]HLZ01662.1 efflux RND transporter periplasmic adaptor subunit [Bradyrhizobium sp.]
MNILLNASRRSRWVLVIVVAVAGAALIWGRDLIGLADGQTSRKALTTASTDRSADTSGGSGGAAAEQSLDLSEKQTTALKVGPLGTHEFQIQKTAVGAVDFNENMLVQVFSQYPGKILKAFYNVGDDVKQGDILFTIDSPDLLQAESTLLASEGVLELQKKTLARATGLLKQGGMAQKDVDQATSDEQTAEGNFKAAQNAVRIFGKTDAEIEQILINRKVDSTLVVKSPITGRVVARNAAPGFLTQPGNAPAPFSVVDISTMWMIANVIETDAPAYKLGQEVQMTVPAYPDKVFTGHVTNLGSTIDPNSHRQLVRSVIDDPEHLLRSGMYASFVVRVGDPVTSLAVPADGVVREGDGTMTVWVTTDRRHFVKRTVTTGLRQDGWVQILDGLQAGETVVTEGAVYLSNKLLLGEAG